MQKTIGIVGGGQLGRMLTDAAHALGFNVTVLDPTPNSPAGQVANKQIVGDFKNPAKIKELAHEVDYITFEIELADAPVLAQLAAAGIPVNPTGDTLKSIKNKYQQKVLLRSKNIPVGEFCSIDSVDDAHAAGERYGYPFFIKARLDAYDGRGNALVQTPDDIEAAFTKLDGRDVYAEELVPFVKELAVIAVRTTDGAVETYDVVETVHKNNICHTVTAPAQVSDTVCARAHALARDVAGLFNGAGAFGIEMFLLADGTLYINEIAPRVHNSGHHTIEYNQTSQFENHIRAVTGMPLGSTAPKAPAAVMINILGERTGPAEPRGVQQAEALGNVHVHLYGKHDTKVERKMGHITVTADTTEEAFIKAQQARALVSI